MNPERWKQIDKLFDAALEIETDKRSAFLDEACEGDHSLREEVESLLASDLQPNKFVESPAIQAASEFMTGAKELSLSFGESIGPYKILSLLGAGGMGEVYRATHSTLERDVAIKVLPERLAIDRTA